MSDLKDSFKKSYKLRGISYMSLSLLYIGVILGITIVCLITALVMLIKKKFLLCLLPLIIGGVTCYYIYSVGIKYGRYGITIMLAQVFQPKVIVNNNPYVFKKLIRKIEEDQDHENRIIQ